MAFAFIAVSFATVSYLPIGVKAATLYVGGGGPDNYTTIQEAIDDADPGDTVFVFNGTYEENLAIGKPISLVGEGRDVTTIIGPGFGDSVTVTADSVNITHLTIKGENSALDGESVIALENVSDCLIAHNDLWNYISGGSSRVINLENSHDNMIEGNLISASHYGIRLSASNRNSIVENVIYGNLDSGINLIGSSDNRIENNSFSFNEFSISIEASLSTTLTGNTFQSEGIVIEGDSIPHFNTHTIPTNNLVNGKPVRYFKDCTGLDVAGNLIGQLIVANCTGVAVSGVHIDDTSVGIQMAYVDDVVIVNTNVSDSTYGILFVHSSDLALEGNDVWNHAFGMTFAYSSYATVANNSIKTDHAESSQWGHGVGPSRSSHIFITSNEISRSAEAIHVYRSNNVTISHNELHWNKGEGVRSWVSENVTVECNNMSNNGLGIRLFDSDRYHIFHNNILNNTIQARDHTATNQWDDGYPSGGNYWSDYTGVDICSGPRQDICPDPDGIGDTPYFIDADSQDTYPLMYHAGIVFPRPPRILDAALSGESTENVTVRWTLSPDDESGLRSIVRYNVYRSNTYESRGLGYVLIAALPDGTAEFMDPLVGEGDSGDYFYRLCAVDKDNATACAAGQAGKIARPLATGPSLISIPLIQSDESIEIVLQTVEYDKAWYYDSSSQQWIWYMKSKTYRRGLRNMDHTDGMWVNVTQDSNLTVAGVVPAQTTIHLYVGWNLVSFPSYNSSYTVADLKAETGATGVEGFDPTPPYHLRVLGDAEVLLAGYGYWLKVDIDVDWIVEVS